MTSKEITFVIGTPRSGSTAVYGTLQWSGYRDHSVAEPSNPSMILPTNLSEDADRLKLFTHQNLRKEIASAPRSNGADWFVKLLTKNEIKLTKMVPTQWTWVKMEDVKTLVQNKDVGRVVFTYREDIFYQCISYCISVKLKFFHGDKDHIRNSEIGALDEDKFRELYKLLKDNTRTFKELSTNPKCKLYKYEDLYTINDSQNKHWQDLFDYVGLEWNPLILTRLNQTRYNGPETYAKVDNLDELLEISKTL